MGNLLGNVSLYLSKPIAGRTYVFIAAIARPSKHDALDDIPADHELIVDSYLDGCECDLRVLACNVLAFHEADPSARHGDGQFALVALPHGGPCLALYLRVGFDVDRWLSDREGLVRIREGKGGGGGKEGFFLGGGGEEDAVYVEVGGCVEVYRLEGGVRGLDGEERGRGDDAAEVEVEDIALVGEREPRGELLIGHGRGRGTGLDQRLAEGVVRSRDGDNNYDHMPTTYLM